MGQNMARIWPERAQGSPKSREKAIRIWTKFCPEHGSPESGLPRGRTQRQTSRSSLSEDESKTLGGNQIRFGQIMTNRVTWFFHQWGNTSSSARKIPTQHRTKALRIQRNSLDEGADDGWFKMAIREGVRNFPHAGFRTHSFSLRGRLPDQRCYVLIREL